MKFKLVLKTKDVAKSWSFYSAIGIKWLGGEDQIADPTAFQDEANPMGLPELWGNLGGVELVFFLDETDAINEKSSAIFRISVDDVTMVTRIVDKLESMKLFDPDPEFDKEYNRILILDPDGRRVELCGASLYGF